MTTEKARPTRIVPLYFDIFVVLAAAMCGLIYGSYYKFPGNVLGPIGGAITGVGWCYIIRCWLFRRKDLSVIFAGLLFGIIAGLLSTVILNIPMFFGSESAYYLNYESVVTEREPFRDAGLISSPFIRFFIDSEEYLTRALWTGGVMGGYLGLIGGAMYGFTNKLNRRKAGSKVWPSIQLDLFYCVSTAVVFGFYFMSIAHYRITPYFFVTFPTTFLLFGGWVLLKRFVCRRVNLWPCLGVLPLYIIDNACLVLICALIFSERISCLEFQREINYSDILKILLIGAAWGLLWGSIFAINKKFFYQPKLQDAEAIDG